MDDDKRLETVRAGMEILHWRYAPDDRHLFHDTPFVEDELGFEIHREMKVPGVSSDVVFTSTGVQFDDTALPWRSTGCRLAHVAMLETRAEPIAVPRRYLRLRFETGWFGEEEMAMIPIPDRLEKDVTEMTELLLAKTRRG